MLHKLQKHITIYNVPNCAIWALPHVLQVELLNPSFICQCGNSQRSINSHHKKKVFEQYQLLKSACLIYITTNVPGVMVAHLIATLYLQNIVFDVRNIEQLKVHVSM